MKVEFIKLHPDFAYGVGDVASFEEGRAVALIEAGYAIPSKEEVETAASKAKPEKATKK